MSKWQPIETAPKEIVSEYDRFGYGKYILAYPANGGGVSRVRWWQSLNDETGRYRNFLGDCGNAYRPTHWMPLPAPPKDPTP
jgi:hypothetical protein